MSSYEHNPGDHEDPLAGPTWLVGVLSVILLSVIVLGVTAMYRHARSESDEQRLVLRPAEQMQDLMESQLEQINAAPRRQEFKDGEQVVERIVIPIEDATDLIVQEYADGG